MRFQKKKNQSPFLQKRVKVIAFQSTNMPRFKGS